MKKSLVLILFLLGLTQMSHATNSVSDSLGIVTIDGKKFIRHKVDQGESLSAISRRYDIAILDIRAANNLDSDMIRLDQILLIPMRGNGSKVNVKVPVRVIEADGRVKHSVTQGETLYSIAKTFNTTIARLKEINGLTSDNLSVGQVVVVSDPNFKPKQKPIAAESDPEVKTQKSNATYFGDSKPSAGAGAASNDETPGSLIEMMENLSPEERDSMLSGNVFPELEVLTAEKGAVIPPGAKSVLYTDPYSGKQYYQVEEIGTAGFIEDYSTDQTRFYAFHKYLPIGSYVRVDYPGKKQSILVEIINSLDKKDPNIIRLSAKCGHYLMLWKDGEKVVIRYVVPGVNAQ